MNSPLLWPYDEVVIREAPSCLNSEILVDSPWMKIFLRLTAGQQVRGNRLVQKFATKSLGPDDVPELNWLFRSLSKYPLCYLLPRNPWPQGLEDYCLKDQSLLGQSPAQFLRAALSASPHQIDLEVVAGHALFVGPWKWDAAGAIQFSQSPDGIDPRSLFSVARRYNLLNCLENDETQSLFTFVRSLKSDPAQFNQAAALMVRQNHYVTERCRGALEPALENARGARGSVQAFIQAENGHDRLLKSALTKMGLEPGQVPVTSQAKILMDLLQFSAERNFLAFAMIVDGFERSAYQDTDPLAQVLEDGGLRSAAQQINRHMEINDSGEHENVALNFLATMGPVGREYAQEAIQMAEITSNVMNQFSSGVRTALLS